MIQSIERALNALDILQERSLYGGGISLSDLSEELHIGNSTARNILKTMLGAGYVSQNERREYILGSKCGIMNRIIFRAPEFKSMAAPLLEAAAKSTGESFVLTSLVNGRRVVLLRAKGSSPITIDSDSTESAAPYLLVTNRIMLAFCDPSQLKKFVRENGLPGKSWKKISTEAKLAQELAEIRDAGYAETAGEDIVSAAYPVFDENRRILAAIGFHIPKYRCKKAKLATLKAECRKITESISKLVKQKELSS